MWAASQIVGVSLSPAQAALLAAVVTLIAPEAPPVPPPAIVAPTGVEIAIAPEALPETGLVEIIGIDADGELMAKPVQWYGRGAPPKIFVTDTTIGATGAMQEFSTAVTDLTSDTTSLVFSRSTTLSAQALTLSGRIRNEQDSIASYTSTLRSQFTAMETQVARYKSLL
jgi:hypothetical protein